MSTKGSPANSETPKKEDKKLSRRERNRASAQKSRQRKKTEAARMECEIHELQETLRTVRDKTHDIKDIVHTMMLAVDDADYKKTSKRSLSEIMSVLKEMVE